LSGDLIFGVAPYTKRRQRQRAAAVRWERERVADELLVAPKDGVLQIDAIRANLPMRPPGVAK